MKKNNTRQQSSKGHIKAWKGPITIGMDLGDKTSRYCLLDGSGEVLQEGSVATTKKGMAQVFGVMGRCRVAMEVGTHSAWVSRLLNGLGYEVIVANARQVKLISNSSRKDDKLDAQMLGRLARVDPELLRPIRHRSEQAQADLMKIRVRAALVEARTSLVNAARGLTKAAGERLPVCDADYMGEEQAAELPLAPWYAALPTNAMTRGSSARAISPSRSAAPSKSAARRSPEPRVVRRAAFVSPMPKSGSTPCSRGWRRRGVKPAACRRRQKSLRGFAKAAPAAALA
jgi:hypothetical protein